MAYGVKLKVWGDYACFTRPEMKVERVTYDVITPSAARGMRARASSYSSGAHSMPATTVVWKLAATSHDGPLAAA